MATRQLPVPDYDHLPAASLQHRIRSLGEDELHQLLSYEEKHGRRTVVMELLNARLAQLRSGDQPTSSN